MWQKKLVLALAVLTVGLTGCASNWNPMHWFDGSSTSRHYYRGYVADSSIANEVRRQIRMDNLVGNEPIIVKARGNHILLAGSVDNMKERNRVIDIARHIQGVASVTDAIRIRR